MSDDQNQPTEKTPTEKSAQGKDSQGAPGAPATPPGDGTPPPADDVAGLQKILAAERKSRRELESKLAEHERAAMSDQEKAVAAARDEGRNEALTQAGKRLAAAEFRAAAAGKLQNADALLDVIDPTKFVGEDGEPNRELIEATVAKLAAGQSDSKKDDAPAGLVFPGGVREPAQDNGDWLRGVAVNSARR